MKKLYLDVDGVFICDGRLAEGAKDFLVFALSHYECFWLSTYSKSGEQGLVSSVFSDCTNDNELLSLVARVKPCKWDRLKTDGIDLEESFFWLDDRPTAEDLVKLTQNNCISSMIKVNIENDSQALIKAKHRLNEEV